MASAQEPLPTLANQLTELVRTVMSEIRPRLVEGALAGQHAESRNDRHTDNFLSKHDLWMHDRYRELLTEIIPSYVYASEEADPQIIGDHPDPDLCVLVDPLDTSELAVRALHGYTHVMVYSRSLRRPIAAVVGDIFHHVQLYVAARNDDGEDHAHLITADGTIHPLTASPTAALPEALVTNFLMKPPRFRELADQHQLLDALAAHSPDGASRGRIGVDFGSVCLCHVAARFTESTIEFAKGFAIWDLAPGHYILHAAGGTVIDLTGHALPLDHGLHTLTDITEAMDRRQTFIAAGNAHLAAQLLKVVEEK
ncbi:inositol monophosphatase family protein [Actinomadura flavalba]|uniref:inositol monophosphatase family protein n=1 Tax=Actinomadura flavalba TaxID=1120938 RepID=UPI00037D15AC|nr:inositol monophosphatase family protein [Actinomadura flavalba]